jgi:hypothetical protein
VFSTRFPLLIPFFLPRNTLVHCSVSLLKYWRVSAYSGQLFRGCCEGERSRRQWLGVGCTCNLSKSQCVINADCFLRFALICRMRVSVSVFPVFCVCQTELALRSTCTTRAQTKTPTQRWVDMLLRSRNLFVSENLALVVRQIIDRPLFACH